MPVHHSALLRAQGYALAVVLLLARASASAAPSPVLEGSNLPVAVDLEGLPRAAVERANPNYSGLMLIRLDGLRPSSFSLVGIVNIPPPPKVVPLGMDLRLESAHPGLLPKR